MIDLHTVKDDKKSFEVNNVAQVNSKCILADALTNIKTSSILKTVLETGKFEHRME